MLGEVEESIEMNVQKVDEDSVEVDTLKVVKKGLNCQLKCKNWKELKCPLKRRINTVEISIDEKQLNCH